MHILHLIYDDLENPWLGGGGATRTWELGRRLVAGHGHTLTVACGRWPGAPRTQQRDGIQYRHIGHGDRGYTVSRVSYAAAAGRLLQTERYDIVVEDVSPYSPVGAPLWTRRPAIASVQNLSGAHALRKYGWGPKGLIARGVERPLLRRFRYAVAVSPGIAAQMRPWWRGRGKRLAVVPNSISAAYTARLQPDYTPPPEEPVILFLGRLDIYQKGLDRLIAAWAAVRGQVPGVRLEIIGGGSPADEARLSTLLAEHGLGEDTVTRRGRLPPDAAADRLARCLFLAMPSRYEAWPLTALEAAACGKPVLGTDIVGLRDAAPPEAHGVLVPADDAAAFAATLVRLTNDTAWRHATGSRGPAWATRFTWPALAAAQARFYQEVASGYPPLAR
jgi:glycosyltransferase involved in cell wall biosynthesis